MSSGGVGRTIGVALLGLGTVGGGVVRLLADHARSIEARLGARIALRAIAVRDPDKAGRVVAVDRSLLSTDVDGVVARPDVDIVCELIGGTTVARRAVLGAIARDKHVVTANKALLAEHGAEVLRAADDRGVDVHYEAAVCGGLPIVRVLRDGLAGDRVQALWGIVNSTSNYIVTAMAASRRPFAELLAEAQRLGYAEADPSLDIGGGDAAHKLAILVNLCFGTSVDVAAIPTEGIAQLEPIDLVYAERAGFAVKPLVVARDHGDAVEARVHPALVPARSPLADVAGARNAIHLESCALGGSLYAGAGAGMLPTAMAVVSDLIASGHSVFARASGAARPRRGRAGHPRPLLSLADVRTTYYLRFGAADRPGAFGRLMTILGEHGVSIEQVHHDRRDVVAFTHESREGAVRAALAELERAAITDEPARVIRIVR